MTYGMKRMMTGCVKLMLVVLIFIGLQEDRGVEARRESLVEDESEEGTSMMNQEKILIRELLRNYKKIGIVGRPVDNASLVMNVSYGMGLIQVLHLDEKNQVLTTNVWCRYRWVDVLMTWDPQIFSGVTQVRVPANKIWTPDIVLYNYADTRMEEHREAMIVVNNDGSVLWIPPAIFKSTCKINITNFPFDIQTCTMKFGSWTYDGFQLDVNFYDDEQVDVSDYVKSNEWELIGHPAWKNVRYYSCCAEPYPDLTFSIQLRRVPTFYTYILVLPCFLLSFLTLVVFWLPPESPAKILLGMNVFVAFFVLLLLLSESTPPAASSIPLIGKYFCMNMILITLSSFIAIIVINTHIRGDRRNRVPDWLRKIAIDGLAWALCMTEFLDPDPTRADLTSGHRPGRSRHVSDHRPVDDLQQLAQESREHNNHRKKTKTRSKLRSRDQTRSTGSDVVPAIDNQPQSASIYPSINCTQIGEPLPCHNAPTTTVPLHYTLGNSGIPQGLATPPPLFYSSSNTLSLQFNPSKYVPLQHTPSAFSYTQTSSNETLSYQNAPLCLGASPLHHGTATRTKSFPYTPAVLDCRPYNPDDQQQQLTNVQFANNGMKRQAILRMLQPHPSAVFVPLPQPPPSANLSQVSNMPMASQPEPPSGAKQRSSAHYNRGDDCLVSKGLPVFDYREMPVDISPVTYTGTGGIPASKALQSDVREIRRLIRAYVARMSDRDIQARVTKEWRIVARVCDRLFFLLYVCTIIVSLATIFPKG